jgi:hypothetical protein
MEQIKIEILNEHLPYELDMLDEATKYIASQEFADACGVRDRCPAWFKRNAAIEAFWTHARNLIEFLFRPKSVDLKVSSASAKDFAPTFQLSLDADKLMTKINEQISHLGYGRKTLDFEKLSHEMSWVKPALDSEYKRLEKLLMKDADCHAHWVPRTPVTIDVSSISTSSASARSDGPVKIFGSRDPETQTLFTGTGPASPFEGKS